jgi:hypothetical protein
MKAYEDISADDKALIDYYEQGNCFFFDKPHYAAHSSSIHAYPAIFAGNPVFFMIPSEYDSPDYANTINDYISMWPLQWNLTNNRLPPGEATALIDRWGNDYHTWIPKEIAEASYGMFRAFAVPISDFEIHHTIVTLALKYDLEMPTGLKPDIVVTNVESTETYYDDYATSVPPFSPSALSTSFYLLSLV